VWGIVAFALGADTAGSGRAPAGLNNIVGLMPTLGVLSTSGVVPACRPLDCVSIFTLTVDDAYRAFEIAATQDLAIPGRSASPWRRSARGRPACASAKSDRRVFGDMTTEAGYEAALVRLKRLGCDIVELPFADFHATADLLYQTALAAERYAAIRDFLEANEAALHPVTRAIIIIDAPRSADCASEADPPPFEFWNISLDPARDRRKSERHSTFRYYLHEITKTEFVAQIPTHAESDLAIEMAAFEKIVDTHHRSSPGQSRSAEPARAFDE
jgi:Asp-tRNA(Asn)/Glu-tRNA(Gln) amidotransferase A subunit family amidase